MLTEQRAKPTVGDLMRHWRAVRHVSQLEVSLRARANPRHLSFIETGRARPSETMIDRLVDALELPSEARDDLLHAAGYATKPTSAGLDSQLDVTRATFAAALALDSTTSSAGLINVVRPAFVRLGFEILVFGIAYACGRPPRARTFDLSADKTAATSRDALLADLVEDASAPGGIGLWRKCERQIEVAFTTRFRTDDGSIRFVSKVGPCADHGLSSVRLAAQLLGQALVGKLPLVLR